MGQKSKIKFLRDKIIFFIQIFSTIWNLYILSIYHTPSALGGVQKKRDQKFHKWGKSYYFFVLFAKYHPYTDQCLLSPPHLGGPGGIGGKSPPPNLHNGILSKKYVSGLKPPSAADFGDSFPPKSEGQNKHC